MLFGAIGNLKSVAANLHVLHEAYSCGELL